MIYIIKLLSSILSFYAQISESAQPMPTILSSANTYKLTMRPLLLVRNR